MKLRDVIKNCFVLNELSSYNILQKNISTIVQDTRKVEKDCLFICIQGETFDGHDFVREVVEAGALAVVVEKIPENKNIPYILVKDTRKAMAQIASTFYGHPSQKMNIIGVTGTNGKTTITHLIDQIVEYCGEKSGIIGTMYNKVGKDIFPTVNTTPDSMTLQKLFHDMKNQEVAVCSVEVSSHSLYLGRVWGTDFDIAVFTNLTQDHLDFHGTMENYFFAKSLLFSQLGNTYGENDKKTAVINIDDEYGVKLIPVTAANVLTYGCKGQGEIQAKDVSVSSAGTTFTLKVLEEEFLIQTTLIGDFNVYNLLAAISASYVAGYPLEKIIEAVALLKGVKGRFELVPSKKGVTAIVDYAHTPDGLKNVLETIHKFSTNKIYCVVGCGGDRDKTKRPIMADMAMKYADVSMFTSDNPRTEDPEAILQDMTGHLEKGSYYLESDRRAAIERVTNLAEPGDIILVAGKGHEDYQIIGKEKHHFDDAEVLAESAMKFKK